MCHKIFRQNYWLYGCIAFVTMLTLPVSAVTITEIATGLSSAVGMDLDETNNRLYFVDYIAGTVKRIDLDPACEDATTAPCPMTVVASGFSNPEDIELDLVHNAAYVTTRSGPGSGGLYKVDLTSGIKKLITYNLGAPQQLVLDVSNNQAFTVGYNDGRLRKIDLTTGVKTTLVQGLDHPVGLTISQDRQFAYISLQGGADRIVRYDLPHCALVDTVYYNTTATPLVSPFFLAFADPTEQSIYVPERSPANRLSRVDLATRTKATIATGLPSNPSGVIVNHYCSSVYISTATRILKANLTLPTMEPGFMGIGHVPFSDIDSDGYASTDPAYFFHVKNAPFGGTLNIFGNLSNFKDPGSYNATYYRVYVQKAGGTIPQALVHSWTSYRWDTGDLKYKPIPIAPEPGTNYYRIPSEYPDKPQFWYPSFLMMRWPTSENGKYILTIELLDASAVPIATPALQPMTVLIDNTPPTVTLHNIYQMVPWEDNVDPCEIVSSGPNAFKFKITAYDNEGHLYSYYLRALYGDNKTLSIASDDYNNQVVSGPPYIPVPWHGVNNQIVPSTNKSMPCKCAYTFYLDTWGRTIDGYNRTQYRTYHKSITVNLPGLTSCYP